MGRRATEDDFRQLEDNYIQISTTESTAMTLFALSFAKTYRNTATLSGVPRGVALADDREWLRMRALEDVVARLKKDFGTWQVAWGEINRLQRIDRLAGENFSDTAPSLGVAGANQQLGLIFAFGALPVAG